MLDKAPPRYDGKNESRTLQEVTDWLRYLRENLDMEQKQNAKTARNVATAIEDLDGRVKQLEVGE